MVGICAHIIQIIQCNYTKSYNFQKTVLLHYAHYIHIFIMSKHQKLLDTCTEHFIYVELCIQKSHRTSL